MAPPDPGDPAGVAAPAGPAGSEDPGGFGEEDSRARRSVVRHRRRIIGRTGFAVHTGPMTESDLGEVPEVGVYRAPNGPLGTSRWAWECPRCGHLFLRTSAEAMTSWAEDHRGSCPGLVAGSDHSEGAATAIAQPSGG